MSNETVGGDDGVPLVESMDEFAISNSHKVRVEGLIHDFELTFGSLPQFVCRAPGRVNLIGEHVDYSDYGVLPMAIDNDFVICCRKVPEQTITIANSKKEKFAKHVVPSWPPSIDSKAHHWSNYFLAGFWGLLEQAGVECDGGVQVLVDGTIPMGAGLSSSSAFVVCAALTALATHNIFFPKAELARICASSEKYVGTEGGGMDQTISIMAQEGVALSINFNPIKTNPVPLPSGCKIVVANSCVESHKQVNAGSQFNKRVVECRSASILLAKSLGLDNYLTFKRLGATQKASGKSLSDMADLVNTHIKKGTFTQDELVEALGLSSRDELITEALSETTKEQTDFNLHDRAYHVFTEAERVSQFMQASNSVEQLGELLDGSQYSLDRMYDCSCEELNTLTAICKKAGALGSRLTGAGWGGCTVSLVRDEDVEHFINTLKNEYYITDKLKAQLDTSLFVSSPGPGARILKL
eukprot:m.69782 g.69782  ORF g.69782 m.69782 type:complete len:469 (+) comp8285_c0_seq1:151-1557(+)